LRLNQETNTRFAAFNTRFDTPEGVETATGTTSEPPGGGVAELLWPMPLNARNLLLRAIGRFSRGAGGLSTFLPHHHW
jgi:hypothetical protein